MFSLLLGYRCFWALSHIVTFTSIYLFIYLSDLSPVSLLVYHSQLSISLSSICLHIYRLVSSIYHSYLLIHHPCIIYLLIYHLCIIYLSTYHLRGFPGGSIVKESSCRAGDSCSIPGSGRSPGEGNGYSL